MLKWFWWFLSLHEILGWKSINQWNNTATELMNKRNIQYLWRSKGKLHFKSNQFGQPIPFLFHVAPRMWHTFEHPVYMGLSEPVMKTSEPIMSVNLESCVPRLTLLVSPPLLLLSVVMVVVMEIMEVRDPLLSMGRESSKDTSPMSLQSNHRYGDHSRFFSITLHVLHTFTYVQYTNNIHTTFLNM